MSFRVIGEEAERHVQGLGGDHPQRRVTERFRCQATSSKRTGSGRSRATNKRARGLFSRSFATSTTYASAVIRGLWLVHRVRPMSREIPQVEGVEHRFVDANGIRIHVAEGGPSDSPKPPILLLHGWPQHWYMWRRVIAGLRSRHRLLAPDLRGFGWTEAPGHGYDGETFAADQVALLDALEIERAFVVGHDWGGWTAMLLGILHPDRVERMVPCNTPHPWARPLRTRGRGLAQLVHVGDRAPGDGPRSLEHGWISRKILSRGNAGDTVLGPEIETVRRQLS